jgi:hypothetical protein
MRITKVLYGLLALPLLAGVASAETPKSTAPAKKPAQLSEKQMDKVTAGWKLLELDTSNTSWTEVLVYQSRTNALPAVGTGSTPASGSCPNCYLSMTSPALSIYSAFGPFSPIAP